MQHKVEDEVLQTLEQTGRNGIDPALLRKAVRQAIVGEVNSRKTVSGQAARLGISEVVLGEPEYSRTYFKRLENVTPESTSGLIQQYLLTNRHTVVTLGPELQAPSTKTPGKNSSHSREFEEIALENGTTLLLQENRRLPKIHCKAVSLGGPLYEPASHRGITELLAKLLTKDTKTRNALTVARDVENVGGSFSSFGGNNTFALSIEVLRSDQDLAFEILGDAILQPAFVEDSFETERASQIAELREAEDEITSHGGKCLRKRFFGQHPLGVGSKGEIQDLENLASGCVRKYWETLMRPGNLVLAVSGDYQREPLIESLQEIAEQLQGNPFQEVDAPFPGPAESGRINETMDREQAVLFQAYPDIGVTDPARPAMLVLHELLNGMSSNLFNEVREKRSMAYFVGAGRVSGIESGMFYLYAGTAPDSVEEVYHQFDLEMRRLASGQVKDRELDRAKARLKVSKRMQYQTAGNRTLEAALNKLYGLPVNEFLQFDKQVDAVVAGDIQSVLQERIVAAEPLQLTVRAEE